MTSTNVLQADSDPSIEAVFATLSVPPERSADSFVLHAPLELAARSSLLALASADARPSIIRRINAIANEWTAYSAPLDNPTEFPLDADPFDELVVAATAGDTMSADAAFVALCRSADPDRVLDTLAELTHDRLGGAGHAAIFVDQVGRLPQITTEPPPGRPRAPDRHRWRLGSQDPLDRRHRCRIRSA